MVAATDFQRFKGQQMARAPRTVTVAKKDNLTPNMVRVTLTGDALADFPEGFEGGYVKLVLPDENERPTVRSMTVRDFTEATKELTLDMVAHGDTGPAAIWANRVACGEDVVITGPGACKAINLEADWFFLAGDMSALPAISVNLRSLPTDATGCVVLEIISDEDKLDLDLPDGVEVHWVVNPDPEKPNTELEDTVMALPWLEGQVAVWVAGEFNSARALRQYFRHDREVPNEFIYLSSYWKIGVTDEGMKAAKRADTEAW